MYLRKKDYYQIIEEEELNIIVTDASTVIRQQREIGVIEEVKSFIRHRYDVQEVFRDVLSWDASRIYYINELIEYSEPDYVAATEYQVGQRVVYTVTTGTISVDNIYEATEITTGNLPTDTDNWDFITTDKNLYYSRIVSPSPGLTTPDTSFTYTTNNYTTSFDEILGWDRTKTIYFKLKDDVIKLYYSEANRTNDVDSIGVCRYENVKNFPLNLEIERGDIDDNNSMLSGVLSVINFIPDLTEWDVEPSNQWTRADNRNQQILSIVLKIMVFELHSFVSKRNTPELRILARDDAYQMLQNISSGKDMTADIPTYEDKKKGQSFVGGNSQRKQNWNY